MLNALSQAVQAICELSCTKGPLSQWAAMTNRSDLPPNCLDRDLPARTWRLRGLYTKIRGPYQDKSDRVAVMMLEVC